MNQWELTSKFEGVVPHLYKDSRGLVTCGVGFLCTHIDELVRMPWSPSSEAALADYQLVYGAPAARAPSFYARLTTARLPPEAMVQMFCDRVANVRRGLRDWHLERMPESAQLALVDMGYNLGVVGLGKFRRLRAACDDADWHSAAAECHRQGVQEARNQATQELFLQAAQEV